MEEHKLITTPEEREEIRQQMVVHMNEEQRLRKILSAYDDESKLAEYEAVRSKYVGKFFKERDGNTCTKIIGFDELDRQLIGIEFDIQEGWFDLNLEKHYYSDSTPLSTGFMEDWEEITEEDYRTAFTKFRDAISQISI